MSIETGQVIECVQLVTGDQGTLQALVPSSGLTVYVRAEDLEKAEPRQWWNVYVHEHSPERGWKVALINQVRALKEIVSALGAPLTLPEIGQNHWKLGRQCGSTTNPIVFAAIKTLPRTFLTEFRWNDRKSAFGIRQGFVIRPEARDQRTRGRYVVSPRQSGRKGIYADLRSKLTDTPFAPQDLELQIPEHRIPERLAVSFDYEDEISSFAIIGGIVIRPQNFALNISGWRIADEIRYLGEEYGFVAKLRTPTTVAHEPRPKRTTESSMVAV